MADTEKHLITGISVGAIVIIILLLFFVDAFKTGLFQAIFGIALAAFGSVLPDIIEPPTHWTHRKTFHSESALGVVVIILGVSIFLIVKFGSHFVTVGLCSLSLGYLTHLILDAQTPMGLPDE